MAARSEARKRRHTHAATVVQSALRMHLARKQYQQTRRAIVAIQAGYRGRRARQYTKDIRCGRGPQWCWPSGAGLFRDLRRLPDSDLVLGTRHRVSCASVLMVSIPRGESVPNADACVPCSFVQAAPGSAGDPVRLAAAPGAGGLPPRQAQHRPGADRLAIACRAAPAQVPAAFGQSEPVVPACCASLQAWLQVLAPGGRRSPLCAGLSTHLPATHLVKAAGSHTQDFPSFELFATVPTLET